MIAHGVREGTKDDAGFAELVLEGGRHRHAVEHRIDGNAGEPGAFMQRNAELGIRLEKLRINLVQTLRRVHGRARRRVIRDVLVVDGFVVHVRPSRLLHGLPVAERLQAPIEQELRFVFLARDGGHDVLVEAGRQTIGFDIGDEPVPILLIDQVFDVLSFAGHEYFQ